MSMDTAIEGSGVEISCIRPLERLCRVVTATTSYSVGRTLSIVNLEMGKKTEVDS